MLGRSAPKERDASRILAQNAMGVNLLILGIKLSFEFHSFLASDKHGSELLCVGPNELVRQASFLSPRLGQNLPHLPAKAIVTNEIVKSGRFAQRTCGGFFHTAVLMAKYLLVKGGALRLAYQSRREPSGSRITQWLVV